MSEATYLILGIFIGITLATIIERIRYRRRRVNRTYGRRSHKRNTLRIYAISSGSLILLLLLTMTHSKIPSNETEQSKVQPIAQAPLTEIASAPPITESQLDPIKKTPEVSSSTRPEMPPDSRHDIELSGVDQPEPLLLKKQDDSTDEATEMVSIRGNHVNIRSGPRRSFQVLYQALEGWPVRLLQESGEWAMIQGHKGNIGWVHRSYISLNRTVIVVSDEAVVNGKRINVRSGPGKNNFVLFKLVKGASVKILASKDDWVNIKKENEENGWVHRSLLSIESIGPVYCRTGPGTQFEQAFSSEIGAILQFRERRGKWYMVVNSAGEKGWINANVVWG